MRIARYLVAVAQSRKEFMTGKPQQKENRREETEKEMKRKGRITECQPLTCAFQLRSFHCAK